LLDYAAAKIGVDDSAFRTFNCAASTLVLDPFTPRIAHEPFSLKNPQAVYRHYKL
jgi:hypothetical protein